MDFSYHPYPQVEQFFYNISVDKVKLFAVVLNFWFLLAAFFFVLNKCFQSEWYQKQKLQDKLDYISYQTSTIHHIVAVFNSYYFLQLGCESGLSMFTDLECFEHPKPQHYFASAWTVTYLIADTIIWQGLAQPKGPVGIQMLAHHIVVFVCFICPWVQGDASSNETVNFQSMCVLLELPSIFLNVDYFIKKHKLSRTLGTINKAILFPVYFFVRLPYTWYMAYAVGRISLPKMLSNDQTIFRRSTILIQFIGTSLIVVANIFWFSFIWAAAMKMLFGTGAKQEKVNPNPEEANLNPETVTGQTKKDK